MTKFCITAYILLYSMLSFSQNEVGIYEREMGLYVNAGLDFRITAMYKTEIRDFAIPFSDPKKQNSGPALYYGLAFFPWTELSINFQNSFHYTLFHYKTIEEDDIMITQGEAAKHKLFIDYHIFLNYYFQVFDEAEVFARVGISVINTNSNFSETIVEFGEEKELNSNFNMTPLNLGIGFKKNRLELVIGMYTTPQTPYFTKSSTLTIPYINLAYTIGKIL